jgi:hypothetical protein
VSRRCIAAAAIALAAAWLAGWEAGVRSAARVVIRGEGLGR